MELWLQQFAMKAGAIVRDAREARDWSQRDLADRVGVSQPAIGKIESGETRKSKYFPKIAQVLEIDLALLDPTLSASSSPTVVKKTSAKREQGLVRLEQEQLTGKYDLPVFSMAQGGPGAPVLSNQPFRLVARPHNLQGVEDAFGVLIAGDSMHPEYREGDIAYVDTHALPRVGDACLFESEQDGTVKAAIKYLDKGPHHSQELWCVRQQNPEKKFTLKKSEWQFHGVLVGKQSGR